MDDPLLRFGIDIDDVKKTMKIDTNALSDSGLDRLEDVKQWFSHYLGKEFAEQGESAILKCSRFAKKRKLCNDGRFHSRLSPIITGSHGVSLYDDPRDTRPSDLRDKEDWVGAEHCCERCQLMTGTAEGLLSLVSAPGYEHYTLNRCRRHSEAGGCAFCELIRRIVSQCETCGPSCHEEGAIRVRGVAEDNDATNRHPFQPFRRLRALKLEIPIRSSQTSDYDTHHDHELSVLAYQDSPLTRYVVGSRPDKKLTLELIRRIRIWLHDCQGKHESCPRRDSPLLPTRVIDTGDGPVSNIRLQTNAKGSRGQYAALSYCWGGDQPFKTTSANLKNYLQNLDVAVLPKTLTDAFRVCREVGLRYLWIDALCILQDDPHDKANEISQMGRLYKDATLTIMAASAKTVYEGFLDNPKPDAPEVKLPFHIDEDSFGAIFVRRSHNSRPYFLDDEPISTRAWALQEMLLSSRIVMFDSYQATLKCGLDGFRPALDTDLHPDSRLVSRLGLRHITPFNFHLKSLEMEHRKHASVKEQDGEDFFQHGFSIQCQTWADVMVEYSRRILSEIDDRYLALSAITEEFQKIWGGDYLAGFWRDCLVQHLGWVGGVGANECLEDRKCNKRLEGPSWSWLSHPSSVTIDPVAISDLEVLSCTTVLTFSDQPFGPVRSGRLVLKARILPLAALPTKTRPNVNQIWKSVIALMPAATEGIALDFPGQPLPGGELKALVLGMTYDSSGDHGITFLVLHKLQSDKYERIGHISLHSATKGTDTIMKSAKWEIVIIE